MSNTYTSTIEVSVWKEHACITCGTKFRYLFNRTKQGQGATPDAANNNAHQAVIKALEKEVDMQPCPGCGVYQPDMIASRRSSRHWWTFWCSVPVLLLVFFLSLADVITYPLDIILLTAGAALTLLIHSVIDLMNPNVGLDANLRLAKEKQESGDLWVPEQKDHEKATQTRPGTGWNLGHAVAYLLLGLGAVAFLLPMLLVLTSGATTHSGWNPPAFGPGDESYVYFNNRITAVKGYWTGMPQVAILNWESLGITGPMPMLAARSNQSNWAGTINIGSKESKTNSPLLYAYVTFPNDERLIGKSLQLRINMNVRYPKLMSNSQYQDVMENYQYNTTVTLSKKAVGANYRVAWCYGMLGGLTLAVVGGLVLPFASRAFARRANPTQIFTPEQPAEMDAVEEVTENGLERTEGIQPRKEE